MSSHLLPSSSPARVFFHTRHQGWRMRHAQSKEGSLSSIDSLCCASLLSRMSERRKDDAGDGKRNGERSLFLFFSLSVFSSVIREKL